MVGFLKNSNQKNNNQTKPHHQQNNNKKPPKHLHCYSHTSQFSSKHFPWAVLEEDNSTNPVAACDGQGSTSCLVLWSRVPAPLLTPSPSGSSGALSAHPIGLESMLKGTGSKWPPSTKCVQSPCPFAQASDTKKQAAANTGHQVPHTVSAQGSNKHRQGEAHQPFWSWPEDKSQGSLCGSELTQQH